MAFSSAWCLHRGWTTPSNLSISLTDLGFMMGACVVDRIRTSKGQALDVRQHLKRFEQGCEQLGIILPSDISLVEIVHQVASKNFTERDFCIVLLSTPGSSATAPQPTLMLHPSELAWSRFAKWYSDGQPLAVSSIKAVPADCWNPNLKNRSRLHYFLADHVAAQDMQAGQVLTNLDGSVTETSLANITVLEGNRLVSPRREDILDGVSLARTMRLAQEAGLEIAFEHIAPERMMKADEILCSSTGGCLWPARSITDPYGCCRKLPGPEGGAYIQLADAWSKDIGLDYRGQARELALPSSLDD